MFSDSVIARSFSCGANKAAYYLCFGLAPYFKSQVFESCKLSGDYCVMFDESLNKSLQSKQLVVLVRFWDDENFVTKYVDSSFLGYSTANVTVSHLLTTISKLDFSNLMGVSMDGPYVNWKIFDLLQTILKNQFGCQIPNVGSCSLHVVNNVFERGFVETQWHLDDFLRSLHWLFKDAPARKEDFLEASQSKLMPLKFCGHRWLENGPAAQRALDILDDLKLCISSVEKGKFNKPSSKSYLLVIASCKDILLPVKLHFFLSVIRILQPFLTLYQKDWPMLLDTFKVLKNESVSEMKEYCDFANFDFNNHKGSISKVSIGFVAGNILKKLLAQKQITDKAGLDLQHDCQKCIIAIVKKIAEKSPLSNQLVRCLASLDPRRMYHSSDKSYLRKWLSF
nr:uncharacterized protein LOC122269187 [Parasteatoda tepidariorum]